MYVPGLGAVVVVPVCRAYQYSLQLIVKEGELICPNCSRSFPIKDGVPNLLLNEDEV